MRHILNRFLVPLWLALGALYVPQAKCQTYSFPLDTLLNGDFPTSIRPWVTATFTTLFPGGVSLTLECTLNVPSEFVGEVGLNLRPGLSPASLLFTQTGGPNTTSISQPAQEDSERLPGAGALGRGLDILLAWDGNGVGRLDEFDRVEFTITGPGDLTAEDFLYYNDLNGTPGQILIGAHLQGIPTTGTTTSGAIIQTIPEPSTPALLLAGLATWRVWRRTYSPRDRVVGNHHT